MNSKNKLPLIKTKNPISPIIKDNKRNIITNHIKRINSCNYSNNMNFMQINENKDIKNSKRIKNNYNEENNNNINNKNNKNNKKKNNITTKKNALSEDSSSETNDNLGTNIPNKKKNLYKSVKKVINYFSPLLRKDSKNNYKVRKISDRYNYEKNEKEKGQNFMNIINEEKNLRSSIKHLNKKNNTSEKKIIFEDLKKNENIGGNMAKRIKEINISTMTVNDSNFAREKNTTPKKNKKDNFNNKYDFLV